MKLFGSFALYPGKTGEYFYNNFFDFYKLDNIYRANKAESIVKALSTSRKEKYSGISITMPFKTEVLNYLDDMSPECALYNSCNTILIENDKLIGFNTDIAGVIGISEQFKVGSSISILGNGSMGRMFFKYLVSKGFETSIFSRSLGNWSERHHESDIYINCTSLGTSEVKSPLDFINSSSLILDLSMRKSELSSLAISAKSDYLSGLAFYKFVFAAQFKIYTGLNADPAYFEELAKIL